jgi:hypothetical protein
MMPTLARIGALVACFAFVVVLAALVVSYVSPRTITLGPRCLWLDHGKYWAGTLAWERFEISRPSGDTPPQFIWYPDAADKPIWPVATAAGAVGGGLIYLSRRRVRAAGCCSSCGYNLTGNVSGVCPECGTAVVGKETKAE